MKFSEYLLCEGNLVQQAKDEEWSDTYDGDIMVESWYPKLTSLKGCPLTVRGTFDCSDNALTTLKDGPKKVLCDYTASENKLTNVDGIADYIGGRLALSFMPTLTSLHDIHKHVRHIGNNLLLIETPIKSHVLGLLLIPGLTNITTHPLPAFAADKIPVEKWAEIVNKHLPNQRGNHAVIECQNELLDAGLDEYAQL